METVPAATTANDATTTNTHDRTAPPLTLAFVPLWLTSGLPLLLLLLWVLLRWELAALLPRLVFVGPLVASH